MSRKRHFTARALAQVTRWVGQSGEFYALTEESLENFVLRQDSLYVLAQGGLARWAGTATDIVDDAESRARFRDALKTASSVLRLLAPADPVERLRTGWDLQGGHLAETLKIAS